jgi:undecaprenyl-diphosphatase
MIAALPRGRRSRDVVAWIATLLLLLLIAGSTGFAYPVGTGWSDELLDALGIGAAVAGVLLAAVLPARSGTWLPAGPWALGAGFSVVLGQLPLAALFTVLFVVTTLPRRQPAAGAPAPLWSGLLRRRDDMVAAGAMLSGTAALGILLEMWEDCAAPGGPPAHGTELGFLWCCLALIGLVWTGRTGGIPSWSAPASGAPPSRRHPWRLHFFAGLLLFLGFLCLTALIQWPAVQAWDAALVRAVHGAGGRGIVHLMRRVSAVGGRDFLIYWLPLILAAVWVLSRGRSVRFFLFTMLAVPGLEVLFKTLSHRARPDMGHGIHFDSYPSGHALAATVLAAALWAVCLPVCRRRWERALLAGSLCLWPVLMAASRVYLGRHYPTDVVGGVLLGVAWVCLCRGLLLTLDRGGFGHGLPASEPGTPPASQPGSPRL